MMYNNEVISIATYVMSDIHGEYEKFLDILDKIKMKEEDTLYILGDILDRGNSPIKVMLKLMTMKNVKCIMGNHEIMAIKCLDFLTKEIKENLIDVIDKKIYTNLSLWYRNGGKTTANEFINVDSKLQRAIIKFIRSFAVYEKLSINGTNYLLVHGGLGNFSKAKKIEDYTLDELVWDRADYSVKYFEDAYLVTGHTPTNFIEENTRPGYIFKGNNHIAIDCGACFYGGRLAAICLDTGEEFYSEKN